MSKLLWFDPKENMPTGYRPVIIYLKSGEWHEGYYCNHPSNEPALDFWLPIIGDANDSWQTEDISKWARIESCRELEGSKRAMYKEINIYRSQTNKTCIANEEPRWYNMWSDEMRHLLWFEKGLKREDVQKLSSDEVIELGKHYFPYLAKDK